MIREANPEIFLRNSFKEYYGQWSPVPVDLIHQREIGFIPFMGSMIRHRSVKGMSELRTFASRNVPRHLYYSTSYYREPEQRVMAEKIWMGAELIFDLDADHIKIPGKPRYDEILDSVRDHTVRLVERFLLDDLGFDPKELLVTFSGGRGYHVHVKSESIYTLTSDSRREITNYIRCEGLDSASFQRFMQDGAGIRGTWREEIDSVFAEVFSEVERGDYSFLKEALGDGRTVTPYVNRIKKTPAGNTATSKIGLFRKRGTEKYQFMDDQDLSVLSRVIETVRERMMCEIDEPVTTDIHRLIRMPGSLHGKTGLRVTPVNLEELVRFDPLDACRVEIWKESPITILMDEDYSIRFGGQIITIRKGESEVPKDLAIFLLAQRRAKLL